MSIASTENTETNSGASLSQPAVELDKVSEKATGKKGKDKAGRKKKAKKHVADVIVHVFASFNNTIITVTDMKGNTLSWATAGGCGFKGSRKSTPFAGQAATMKALKTAKEYHGIQNAEVRVYGPGPGRDASVRAVRDFAFVNAIYDVTGVPFNGCRAEKERRV